MNKMGTEPVNKMLLTMGIPIVISMVVQAFYNIVDSYFVSKMTDSAIAGIGEYVSGLKSRMLSKKKLIVKELLKL